MTSIQFGAIYCSRQHMDYLESSVLSIVQRAAVVLIGTGLASKANEEWVDRLKTLPDCAGKIETSQANWLDQTDCFNTLVNLLYQKGIGYALLMEPEDIYSGRDLLQILDFAREHPEAGQFQIRVQSYWRGLTYRVEPIPPEPRVILTRVSSATHFESARRTNELPLLTIPEETGLCHSFTFSSHFDAVQERLFSSGVSAPIVQKWKQTTWDSWQQNRALRNLHPTRPETFRGVRRINPCILPEALSNHRYLKEEVVNIEPKPKPTCSVIFEANSPLSLLQELVQSLVETVPSDCELIGCADETEPDLVRLLKSKPGLKVVLHSRGKNSWTRWVQGSRVAEGQLLVFMRDSLNVEGDWLEGLQSAFERAGRAGVFSPRIIVDKPSAGSSCSTRRGDETNLLPSRSLAFEQRRGRCYGIDTQTEQPLSLDEALCWCCSAGTWNQLLRKELKGTPPPMGGGAFGLETFVVEDTPVFAAFGQTEAPESPTFQEGFRSVKAAYNEDIPPTVSIIIPVYNNLHFTKACLESIFAQTPMGNFEVIVVDNASTDGTAAYLESLQDRIRYIHNRRNLFFAKGCNRGAWAARGEYLLFLNNDTVVKAGWLSALLDTISKDPKIGIVGNKQLFPRSNLTSPNVIWHAGVAITADRDPWHLYYGLDSDNPLVNKERDYAVITGCCLLIRASLFEGLNGFDSQFQNGFEDVDLCLRAGEKGYRVVYTPQSEIIHHVSSTESRFDREITNLQKFRKKWAERLIPDEIQCYQEAGLIPPAHQRVQIRVGYVSPFNQKDTLADYARHLLVEYPPESYVVLSEFTLGDRIEPKDPPFVLRSWDRSGTWYYPLFRWATTLDLDIVHFNFAFRFLPARILELLRAIRHQGKKLVATFHETSLVTPLLTSICETLDAAIVHTPESRLELMLNGCDPSKIHVILPGILGVSEISLTEARQKKGIGVSQKMIATPGFVRPQKGIVEAIAALAELRKYLDVYYLILGSTDPRESESVKYLEECRRAIDKYQLQQSAFIFDEFLEQGELRDYLNCADVIALPYTSDYRGWSGSAATALSSGRPVITSAAPTFFSIRDAVLQSSGGIALVQAMHSVLTNVALERDLIFKAKRFAEAHTWKDSADAHWEIYRKILKTTKAASPPIQPRECFELSSNEEQTNLANGAPHHAGPFLLWAGDFLGAGNNGDSARAMALALASQSMSLRIEDSSTASTVFGGKTLFHLSSLLQNSITEPIVYVEQRASHLWNRRAEAQWNAVRYLFSGERLSEEAKERLRSFDELWVSSRFHYDACLNSGILESKLFLLPETLDLPLLQGTVSPLAIDGLRGFNFLSIFPWHSSSGWDLLLQAFLTEFKQNEEVTLVLKADAPPGSKPQDLLGQISHFISARAHQNAAKIKNVLVLIRDLTPKEVVQLFKSCQAFVLPSRAEDSGRSIMTAMALGLPVTATACGCNRGLMSSDNSYPLEYRLVEIPARLRCAPGASLGTQWAETSVEEIREAMRQVYSNVHEARLKADRARRQIVEACDWQRLATTMRGHLQEISERLRRPSVRTTSSDSRPHVCWEGPQLVNHSLALVNREFELALIASDEVNLTVLPIGQDSFGASLSAEHTALAAHYGKHLDKPTDVHVRHQWPPNWTAPREGHWIVIQPWEYGSLPTEWVERINQGVDEVWAPSEYVRRVYVESGVEPARVHVIPNGVNTEFFRPGLRPLPLGCSKSFKFLFLGGTIHRKGADVLLHAYRETFKAEDDVVLIIKDMGTNGLYKGQGLGGKIRELQQDRQSPSIVYLDKDLTDLEIAQLYNACDCLVHPYRGEGFGLPVLEAMACGLPVIVTAGGATDDFVDEQTGYVISSKRLIFGNRVIGDLKTVGDLWLLEPDAAALSKALKHVFGHREEAKRIGANARERVEQRWTWQHSARKVLQRVNVLSKEPIKRFQENLDCVVLLELDSGLKEFCPDAVKATIRSLQRNTYAKLKIVLWTGKPDARLEELAKEDGSIQVIQQVDLPSLLTRIRHRFRAHFLGVVSEPVIFSRQWFEQIRSVADQIGSADKIIAPSINLPEAEHYIPYQGTDDDFAFQKFARGIWRSHRGSYQEMSSLPLNCSVVSWNCLALGVEQYITSCGTWLKALQEDGVKVYWAKDTYVGNVAALFQTPQPV